MSRELLKGLSLWVAASPAKVQSRTRCAFDNLRLRPFGNQGFRVAGLPECPWVISFSNWKSYTNAARNTHPMYVYPVVELNVWLLPFLPRRVGRRGRQTWTTPSNQKYINGADAAPPCSGEQVAAPGSRAVARGRHRNGCKPTQPSSPG